MHEREDLEPHIFAETLRSHYGKHHAKYVSTLNDLIPGTAFEEMPLEMIVRKATGKIFNHAAQTWNHTLLELPLAERGRAGRAVGRGHPPAVRLG